jgi:threonine aldolase
MIDLRSDTVTKPSPGMRRAMAEADVGDDVFGEDPCVNRLQEVTARLLGKEAALYVPSGTMANQLCIKVHTQAGDEIIMERTNHPFNSESGALAALSGVQVNLIDGTRGVITAAQAARAIRHGDNVHNPRRACVTENTHNRGGGNVYPVGPSARSAMWRSTDSPRTLMGRACSTPVWPVACRHGDCSILTVVRSVCPGSGAR